MNQTAHRHLLAWHQWSDAEWDRLVRSTVAEHQGRRHAPVAPGAGIGLIFFNSSLRTRTSMEAAAVRLGLHPTTIIPGKGTWGFEWRQGAVMDGDRAEHIKEAIGVLCRYYRVLGVRAFASGTDYEADRKEHRFKMILDAATVPVINMESAFYHPCQALADAGTLRHRFGGHTLGKKLVLTWAYHPKALPMAVSNSALLMATRLGMSVTVARPRGFALDARVMARARAYAARRGQRVEESTDQRAAARGADVIYAKAWGGALRYSDPVAEAQQRESFKDWRIGEALMQQTNGGVFMHCLPVRRNVVVDDKVMDGSQAIHLLQAEFRLHAQVAILARLLA